MAQKQVIAKSPWYEIYREVDGDAVRVVVRYTDRANSDIYSMRAVEINRDLLTVRTKWNLPERRGERFTTKRLQLDAAAHLRGRLMTIESVKDFEGLLWELNIINQAEE
jgi:hypothetical protein